MRISAKKVLLPEGWRTDCTIEVENGRVQCIRPRTPEDACSEIQCDLVAPGLIDQHVHGGFGADVMLATPEQLLNWLQFLARQGVTQVLAGVYTYPVPAMRSALETVRLTMDAQAQGAGGARLTGVHLEGPFISKRALGAMSEPSVLAPSVEAYKRITAGYEDMIRLITVAPEEEGAQALIDYLRAQGVAVQAGHTAATAEEGAFAFDHGVQGITHFFNASTPIRHRAPGILTRALLDERVYCECICDLVHVHPDAIRLVYRCKGERRMIIVSDAVFTTGLPDGEYTSLDETFIVKDGASRTPEGALAGGGSTLLREVRNLTGLGIELDAALRMASQTPAEFLKIPGGRIEVGAQAELLCLNDALQPLYTVIGAQCIEGDAL